MEILGVFQRLYAVRLVRRARGRRAEEIEESGRPYHLLLSGFDGFVVRRQEVEG